MTIVTIESYDYPATVRAARRLEGAGSRAAEELAGRTVWCATALPAGREAALALTDCLLWAGDSGVVSSTLEVRPLDPVRKLAERLAAMLEGAVAPAGQLGPAEGEVYAEATRDAGNMVGDDVRPDDVVVVHDPLTAALAQAIRERGAHVVWRIDLGAARRAGEAWSFLRPFTSAVDAYLTMWPAPQHGTRVERITAVVPSSDTLTTRDIAPGPAVERRHDLGWSSALAAAVAADRTETVGGTRHARPTTPAR
jgi:trehalose synthase